jgi:hypothetical protein
MKGVISTENIFEPRAVFYWNETCHYPAQPAHPMNPDKSGKEASYISLPDEMVLLEIEKGKHPKTNKPISGLLNHCNAIELTRKCEDALKTFFDEGGEVKEEVKEEVKKEPEKKEKKKPGRKKKVMKL